MWQIINNKFFIIQKKFSKLKYFKLKHKIKLEWFLKGCILSTALFPLYIDFLIQLYDFCLIIIIFMDFIINYICSSQTISILPDIIQDLAPIRSNWYDCTPFSQACVCYAILTGLIFNSLVFIKYDDPSLFNSIIEPITAGDFPLLICYCLIIKSIHMLMMDIQCLEENTMPLSDIDLDQYLILNYDYDKLLDEKLFAEIQHEIIILAQSNLFADLLAVVI